MGMTLLFRWASNFVDNRYPEEIEHPDSSTCAIAKLLLFAGVEGLTDPTEIVKSTGYPIEFVLAVTWNMRNNRLWTASGYDISSWLSLRGEWNEREFWEHISAAGGELWFPGAESDDGVDAHELYWRCVKECVKKEGEALLKAT